MKRTVEDERRHVRLLRRHQTLRQRLAELGPTLQGTILRRVIPREDPNRPGRVKNYGPYYQWTRKVEGRTVIQNLTAPQAIVYRQAIRENRALEKTLCEMRAISLKILQLTTQGVQKRTQKRKKNRPLS
jgi:hypothetical protein